MGQMWYSILKQRSVAKKNFSFDDRYSDTTDNSQDFLPQKNNTHRLKCFPR